MKKYRYLWNKSTTNHNILYFVHIPGSSFINKGKCLLKSANSRAGCGIESRPLPQLRCTPRISLPPAAPSLKPSPPSGRLQGAETVHLGRSTVEMWRCRDRSIGKIQWRSKMRGPSPHKVRLGRDHLLVQNANDTNSIGHGSIENDVLAHLKPVQPRLD